MSTDVQNFFRNKVPVTFILSVSAMWTPLQRVERKVPIHGYTKKSLMTSRN